MMAAQRGMSMRVTKAITINHPVEEIYAFWRDFENLPRFMYHLQMVENTGGAGRIGRPRRRAAGRRVGR